MIYDVTIIGAGVSGIFTAYTLVKSNKNIKVCILDKGEELHRRICPIEVKKTKSCMNCSTCHKFLGFGGMGRSEGKFNYTNDFGGELWKIVGKEEAMRYMYEVDRILCDFGGDKAPYYSTYNEELCEKVEDYGFKFLTTRTRHLGTMISLEMLEKMYNYLNNKIDIYFREYVDEIKKREDKFSIKCKNRNVESKRIVIATGLSGGEWFEEQCKSLGIEQKRVRLDMGFRIEMKENQLQSLLKDTFEIKLLFQGEDFNAVTYCMNPKGRVIRKYQNGLVFADGQNFLEESSPSNNMNFTLFIDGYFNSSKSAKEYVKDVVGNINRERDRIVVERLKDIKSNTKPIEIESSEITPTLCGEYGNVYDEVPQRYIDITLNFIHKLENLLGEEVHPHTVLYGLDTKYYEPEMNINKYFETEVEGLYLAGDCSGLTYSLSQAAASGIYIGKHLSKHCV